MSGVVLIAFLAYYFFIKDYCSLSVIQTHRAYLLHMVNTHYVATIILFCIAYILFTAIALPEAGMFSIAGGFLFGKYVGMLLVIPCATIGGLITFIAMRYFIGGAMQKKHSGYLHSFNHMIQQHGARYLLFVRLITIIPFFIVNLLAGITTISVFTFIWTTCIGIIPGTYAYVLIGEQLATIGTPGTISLNASILSVIIIIACLVITGLLFMWWNKRKNSKRYLAKKS